MQGVIWKCMKARKPTSELQFKLRCNLIRGTKDKKIIPTVLGLSNQLDEKECYQQMI